MIYVLPYILAIALAFCLLGVSSKLIQKSGKTFKIRERNKRWAEWFSDLSTELIGAVVTVFLFGVFITYIEDIHIRSDEQLASQITRGDHELAIQAITELQRRGSLNEALAYINLSGLDLSGANLTQANLSGHLLIGTDLSGATLHQADLQADLDHANLRGADLSEADLHQADLNMANLQDANLWRSNLDGAFLVQANLEGADLFQANLSNANLRYTHLIGARLTYARLSHAILEGAMFHEAQMMGVDLEGADLRWAQITDEQLQTVASLVGARLPDGSRYDGRFNLPGDINGAQVAGADPTNPSSMADFYGVTLEQYLAGQE